MVPLDTSVFPSASFLFSLSWPCLGGVIPSKGAEIVLKLCTRRSVQMGRRPQEVGCGVMATVDRWAWLLPACRASCASFPGSPPLCLPVSCSLPSSSLSLLCPPLALKVTPRPGGGGGIDAAAWAMWPLISVRCTGCGSPRGPLSGVLNPHSPGLGLCGLPAPYPLPATYGLRLGCKSKLGPCASS